MLRKHKIEKNIKHIINQMLYTFPLYSMYNVIIEFDNIKHQIIFYEKDNKMLNTLNK